MTYVTGRVNIFRSSIGVEALKFVIENLDETKKYVEDFSEFGFDEFDLFSRDGLYHDYVMAVVKYLEKGKVPRLKNKYLRELIVKYGDLYKEMEKHEEYGSICYLLDPLGFYPEVINFVKKLEDKDIDHIKKLIDALEELGVYVISFDTDCSDHVINHETNADGSKNTKGKSIYLKSLFFNLNELPTSIEKVEDYIDHIKAVKTQREKIQSLFELNGFAYNFANEFGELKKIVEAHKVYENKENRMDQLESNVNKVYSDIVELFKTELKEAKNKEKEASNWDNWSIGHIK